MKELEKHIKSLEDKLLHSDIRRDSQLLNDLLGENFEEVGSNGQISSREEVIDWLVAKEKDAKWLLTRFRIRELAPDLILANYLAKKINDDKTSSGGSIRSSLWQLSEGKWKMIFHQGTKVLNKQ